jgi:hypothetical protein
LERLQLLLLFEARTCLLVRATTQAGVGQARLNCLANLFLTGSVLTMDNYL